MHLGLRTNGWKFDSGLVKKPSLKKVKQLHNKLIKIGHQRGFRVGQSHVVPYMEHVDNQGVPCHKHRAIMFKGTCLEYVP